MSQIVKLHNLQPGFTISAYLCSLSGVIERWELLQAQSRSEQHAGSLEPQQLISGLDDITAWLETVIPALENHQKSDSAASIEDMTAKAKDLKVSLETENNRSEKTRPVLVAVLTDSLSLTGDAQDFYSLQVHDAVHQPARSGGTWTTGQGEPDEPRLEPSVHEPPAVGH